VSQPEVAKKFTITPYFGGSMSFKIIDVDTTKKFVASACYDTQMVANEPSMSTLNKPIAVK